MFALWTQFGLDGALTCFPSSAACLHVAPPIGWGLAVSPLCSGLRVDLFFAMLDACWHKTEVHWARSRWCFTFYVHCSARWVAHHAASL